LHLSINFYRFSAESAAPYLRFQLHKEPEKMKFATKTAMAILLGTVLLSGCATAEKMDQPTYERLAAKAKEAIAKSDSVKYTWTNSEDAMEKAEEAAKSGDWAKAIKEVKLAREFSELAYQQYEHEQNPVPALD